MTPQLAETRLSLRAGTVNISTAPAAVSASPGQRRASLASESLSTPRASLRALSGHWVPAHPSKIEFRFVRLSTPTMPPTNTIAPPADASAIPDA